MRFKISDLPKVSPGDTVSKRFLMVSVNYSMQSPIQEVPLDASSVEFDAPESAKVSVVLRDEDSAVNVNAHDYTPVVFETNERTLSKLPAVTAIGRLELVDGGVTDAETENQTSTAGPAESASQESVTGDAVSQESTTLPPKPVTEAPTSSEPVTDAPVSQEPVTEAPTPSEPVTDAPVSQEPVTDAPVSQEPVTDAPVSQEPVTEEVASESPQDTSTTSAPMSDVEEQL